MRLFFASILILITISACALGAESAGEISLTVIPMDDSGDFASVPIIENTEAGTATVISSPTLTPLAPRPTHTPTVQPVQNTQNCVIRSDLPTYTVTAGDTLSNIASRYGTSTAELSAFNCLTDANLISTGMTLHVPFIPPTPTLPALPTDLPVVQVSPMITDLGIRGTLGVYPTIESGNPSDWNDYVIEPETAFTISWTGIEPEYYQDIISATFFFTPDVGATAIIGVDDDMSDGMSITWNPPAGVSGLIIGSARTVDNANWRSSTLHVREPE